MGHSEGTTVFARRLRDARLRKGLSQRQLGIKAGLDESSASPRINQYETGKHVPSFQTAERLAKVLGVPAPYFFASDDALANWILAYDSVAPAARKSLLASRR